MIDIFIYIMLIIWFSLIDIIFIKAVASNYSNVIEIKFVLKI